MSIYGKYTGPLPADGTAVAWVAQALHEEDR